MKILNLTQGSAEWHAARLQHFCASEAPAMLGLSKYQTRNDLLKMKATGITPDVDAGTKALFDRGHAAEALARPIAEQIIGAELYPCTGSETVDGLNLLASFDGLTLDESICWEHKLWNTTLADHIRQTGEVPETHRPQVAHQLIVSGAQKCLFMVSDGTKDRMEYCWYEADARQDEAYAMIAGWKQFAADLAAYQPAPEAAAPAAVPVENLPSLVISVTGSLAVSDNMKKFGEALRSFIDRTPKKPETDDEFAVCESAIKTLTKAEEALDAAESAALAQVSCIDEMRMLKATLRDLARNNRLALEKLVKAEKENRRLAIVTKAQKDLAAFASAIPEAPYMPTPTADFGSAIKGLKTMTSIQNAVDTELARVKIEANEIARKIRANLDVINEHPEHRAMFADVRALVLKDCDFVALTVKQRIADHVAEIARREEEARARIQAEADAKAKAEADRVIEAERAKIRAEEEARARIQAEADAKAKAEADRVIEAERAKIRAEEEARARIQAEADAKAKAEADRVIEAERAKIRAEEEARAKEAAAQSIQEAAPVIAMTARSAPSMSIGTISKRLGFTVSREFLSFLGFEGTKDRAAYLYHEEDFRMICSEISLHVLSVSAQESKAAA